MTHFIQVDMKRFNMRRILFSQLKVGETYYEYYTDCRDKFIGYDGYCAIFKQNVFFAYKKCKFYELVPFKQIVFKENKATEFIVTSFFDSYTNDTNINEVNTIVDTFV